MGRSRHLYITITLLLTLASLAAVAQAGAAAKSDSAAVKKGVHWIRTASIKQFPGTGFRSDTLSALVAARKNGVSVSAAARERLLKAIRAEANNYAGTAGEASKVILAAVAGGENPRCFGPSGEHTDFLDVLESEYDAKTGRYGRTAFDHGLAMVALRSARVKVPAKAVAFARARRGQFGWGFGLVKSGGDDVESTALMIEGMRAAGVKKSDRGLRAALRWITYQRNSDGGYNPKTSTIAGETQADTTAYAIRAADSMGMYKALMKRAKRALRALQKRNGAFRAQPSADSEFAGIATSNAVLALTGRHLPVSVRSKPAGRCS